MDDVFTRRTPQQVAADEAHTKRMQQINDERDMRTERCRCGQEFTYDANEELPWYCEACTVEEREAYEAELRRDAYIHDAYDRAGDR
jgi:hypothetical protein